MHILPLPGWTILSVVMTYTQRSWRCRFLKRAPRSDHLPIYAKFLFDIGVSNHNEGNVTASNDSIPFVKYQWAKASDMEREGYRQGTRRKLSKVTVPTAIFCKKVSCKDSEHKLQIDYNNSLCNILTEVRKITILTCR